MSTNANKIKDLENEIEELNAKLEIKKKELKRLCESDEQSAPVNSDSLTNTEICRFSRQIILPEIGVKGQIKLRNANVLIVGAGGLGKYRNDHGQKQFFVLFSSGTKATVLKLFRLSISIVLMRSWNWSHWSR